eukprot:scaffold11126_cov56-Attheya_sp.AAC.8
MTIQLRALLVICAGALCMTNAFQTTISPAFARSTTRLWDTQEVVPLDTDGSEKQTSVELFLKEKFPDFHKLACKNEDIWKTLAEATGPTGSGCTVFAPNADAFKNLGEKKLFQLEDARNLETAQKISSYHVVPIEAVTYQKLRTEDWTIPKPADGSPRPFTVRALTTLGGEVPVGRSKSGGFMGIFAKEDGGAVVGPNSRILASFKVGEKCFVHEVDGLVSPEILWRYFDQLRIPGF